MTLKDIFEETGGFSLYQKLITFGCLALTLTHASVTYWTQIFIVLTPPHRCKLSLNDTDWIIERNFSDDQDHKRCQILYGNETISGCVHGIIYDFSLHFPTYVTEHDLVCDNAWKATLIQTIYFTGTIVGFLVLGFINDNYGRRRAFQCAIHVIFGSDVASYFCDKYIPFVIFRFFSASAGCSMATIAYVLAIEHTIPSKRRLLIVVWALSFAMTASCIPWIAYAVQNWRYILMFSWAPSAVCTIMSYFFPESISWLLTKGRTEEAIHYIQRMAKVNGKPISKETIMRHLEIDIKNSEKDNNVASVTKNLEEKKKKIEEAEQKVKEVKQKSKETIKKNKEVVKSSYRTLVTVIKLPKLRNRIICLAFLWFTASACYNGNNLELSYLPFNIYVAYSLGALLETPGTFLVALILDKIGRRWTNAGFFIAAGLFGILGAVVSSNKAVILTFVILTRICFASAFDITFSFSSELIPTEIRGRTLSIIRICGGVGNVLAPSVVSLAQNDPMLPLAVFGALGIVAGIAMLSLPETTHQQLPQTLEEGENFGKDQSFWFCPFLKPRLQKENAEPNQVSTFGKVANSIFETNEQIKCVGFQPLPEY